ncbi:MarR family transcriptional regulator [Paractinoplanes deccanensis]|uniref:MarR family transcriptional regulator n=1 Tax=Paractinoplanes deccanensis TaxID=113561 RepID=A0ABQ3YHT1_9ACTN|nr:MarR family transcriptional regulator [Actinoplanes deccanensis]GID79569.1 MarR family transcriptional regulator [Actinoplanes deccanensis]
MAQETRWLDDQEREAWISLSQLMFLLPSALDAQLLRDNNITLFDYMVLSGLSMSEGRTLRMSELARMIASSLSRLSNVVKRLETRGLLRREPDPCNGRYTVAILTDEGWDLVVKAAPGHVEAVRRYVIDGLTDEQIKALREVACHVTARVQAGLGECTEGQVSEGDDQRSSTRARR